VDPKEIEAAPTRDMGRVQRLEKLRRERAEAANAFGRCA